MSSLVLKEKLFELELQVHLKRVALALVALSVFFWGIGLFRIFTTDVGHKIARREGIEALLAALLVISPSLRKFNQPAILLSMFTGYLTVFIGFFLIQVSVGSTLLTTVRKFVPAAYSNLNFLMLVLAVLGNVLLGIKVQSSIIKYYHNNIRSSSSFIAAKDVERPRNFVFLHKGPLMITEEVWSEVAIILPAYNEEEAITDVLTRIKRLYPAVRLYVVDDGSTDSTGELARQNGAIVLRHKTNQGVGGALNTGLTFARSQGAQIIVTIDSDRQHNPKDIARLVFPIAKGYSDFVMGSRFLDPVDKRKMPIEKQLGNIGLTAITNFISGARCSDSQSGFRAFSADAARKVRILHKNYGASSEIVSSLAKKVSFCEIPIAALYDRRTMMKGTDIRSGIRISLDLFIGKFTRKKPIRLNVPSADKYPL
ncbi:MAG: glycosyltransferase family 2 protein [Candidatus Hodarchaeota archaeon]